MSEQELDEFNGLHAQGAGNAEYSLCGFAFDAHDSGDSAEPIVFAQAGEQVTCQRCRAQIDHVRNHFRRYRYVE